MSVYFRMPARTLLARLAGFLLVVTTVVAVTAPTAVAATPDTVRTFGVRATSVAAKFEGVPYLWGGTTRRGFDCSGYTRHVYAKLGKEIPRTSQAQYDGSRKVGKRVRPGDLVFFYRSTTRTVFHVGIYAGDGRIWHAGRSGTAVHKERIWTSRWTGGRY